MRRRRPGQHLLLLPRVKPARLLLPWRWWRCTGLPQRAQVDRVVLLLLLHCGHQPCWRTAAAWPLRGAKAGWRGPWKHWHLLLLLHVAASSRRRRRRCCIAARQPQRCCQG
jgi:hypothetical protein